jgi:hypothetical protein
LDACQLDVLLLLLLLCCRCNDAQLPCRTHPAGYLLLHHLLLLLLLPRCSTGGCG